MLEYDPHYPTILPLGLTLALVWALNILVPVSAFFLARRMTQRRWRPHVFACLWLLFSPVVMVIMAIPTRPPDEDLGPAIMMFALPPLMELPIVFIVYAVALLFLGFGRPAPPPSVSDVPS